MEPQFRRLCRTADDRQDPFWYEGPCASLYWAGFHYEVLACGEITVRRRRDRAQMRWEDIAREAVNDAGLARLVGQQDNLVGPYYFEQSNWFEVIRDDRGGTDDFFFNYKEAVAQMYWLASVEDRFVAIDC